MGTECAVLWWCLWTGAAAAKGRAFPAVYGEDAGLRVAGAEMKGEGKEEERKRTAVLRRRGSSITLRAAPFHGADCVVQSGCAANKRYDEIQFIAHSLSRCAVWYLLCLAMSLCHRPCIGRGQPLYVRVL